MTAYIIRRLLLMIPVALLVSIIIFTLLRLTPGDPDPVLLGEEPNPTTIATLRHRVRAGSADPDPVRQLDRAVLHGDHGAFAAHAAAGE